MLADGSLGSKPGGPEAVGLQRWDDLVGTMPEEHAQLLNLTHTWLRSVLPHVLSKVGRVHYGLLPDSALLQEAASSSTPQARQLLAVPFVGKDVPSQAAEFSHPDALIGLSILAYRHEGLRPQDLRALFCLLLETMGQEGGPFRDRPTCRMYSHWIELAGRHVRGASYVGQSGGQPRGGGVDLLTPEPDQLSARNSEAHDQEGLWPLQLVNPGDAEQMGVLFGLLGQLPHAIQHYLEQLVFPLTMQHQSRKLSANGQDLGSSALFGCRLGFSGTPTRCAAPSRKLLGALSEASLRHAVRPAAARLQRVPVRAGRRRADAALPHVGAGRVVRLSARQLERAPAARRHRRRLPAVPHADRRGRAHHRADQRAGGAAPPLRHSSWFVD